MVGHGIKEKRESFDDPAGSTVMALFFMSSFLIEVATAVYTDIIILFVYLYVNVFRASTTVVTVLLSCEQGKKWSSQ